MKNDYVETQLEHVWHSIREWESGNRDDEGLSDILTIYLRNTFSAGYLEGYNDAEADMEENS